MLVLHILGIVGKILLVLLLILIALILLLLLVPFTYKADILKQDKEFRAEGNVGWLLHAVHFGFSFDKDREDEKLKLDLRFLGIPLMPLIRKFGKGRNKNKKEKNKKKGQEAAPAREIRWEAPRKPTVEPGQRRVTEVEITQTKKPGVIQRAAARIMAFIGKIRKAFRKLRDIGKNVSVWIDYLQSDSFDRAKDCLIKEGTAIARHVLPRKIRGTIRFGTGDPAKTGMITGAAYIAYPVFPEELILEPDFLESRFDADVSLKGHIQLIVPVFHAVRIVLQKDVRRLISRIRKQINKGKGTKKDRVRKKQCQKTMNLKTT